MNLIKRLGCILMMWVWNPFVMFVKNLVWPPLCFMCGCIVKGEDGLCGACWGQITWIGKGSCARCGYPLKNLSCDEAWLCGSCLQDPPLFDQGRSVFVYNEYSQSLVLGLKHGDRTYMAPALGGWLARAAQGLYDQDTWIVPVPIHWTRLWSRSYNQAALLGVFLARILKIPQYDVLRRTRPTAPQGNKTRHQRHKNVKAAFCVRSRYANTLKGRTILLVDDVWTTGATLNACVRTLKDAGAARIHVLTLARVALES